MLDDAALIRAAQSGNSQTFSELINRYYPTLYRFPTAGAATRWKQTILLSRRVSNLRAVLGNFVLKRPLPAGCIGW